MQSGQIQQPCNWPELNADTVDPPGWAHSSGSHPESHRYLPGKGGPPDPQSNSQRNPGPKSCDPSTQPRRPSRRWESHRYMILIRWTGWTFTRRWRLPVNYICGILKSIPTEDHEKALATGLLPGPVNLWFMLDHINFSWMVPWATNCRHDRSLRGSIPPIRASSIIVVMMWSESVKGSWQAVDISIHAIGDRANQGSD